MSKPHRTFRVTLGHLTQLLLRGWVWGSTLVSPSGRRQWTVRVTGPGMLQLEPVFPGHLALTQPERD